MSSELALFFLLFARMLGFFLFSPFFAGRLSPTIRFALSLTLSLLLLPPLTAKFSLGIDPPWAFSLHLLKELGVGYLLGFLFSLLWEAAAFAGQFVGTLAGFSATELLDPAANSLSPLWSRFFSLFLFTLLFAADLHHPLLRLLYENFPFPNSLFETSLVQGITYATATLFTQALSYAFFPFVALSLLLLCFAVASRLLPHLQIFFHGFPLQILLGLSTLAASIGYFFPLFTQAFKQFFTLARNLLFPLT
ncbi:MAG: hypothetical protein K940chlam9_00364 [Chlamydiae bacterium]|nr:hypothetical protein [Chlamydiota bacterium]